MFKRSQLFLAVAVTGLCTMPLAGQAKTFTETLTSGKTSMNVRMRYENVDDKAFDAEAEAMTVRTRLGYETAPYYGVTALVEFEDTHTIGGMDRYQLPPPPAASATGNALIADPEDTELNRVQLRYRGVSKLDVALGRQRLMFDNQRFIGNVGFRQDEQTFDAFSATYTGIADWTFAYAYVDQVNGITSAFDANVNDTLINIAYSGFTFGKFSAYSYRLTNEEENLALVNAALGYFNNDTTGIRFDGAYMLPTTSSMKAIYRAEYAKQSVDKNNTATPPVKTSYDTKYGLAELGMAFGFKGGAYALTPLVGYELLGSDDGKYALQTPYATKHAFQGWVDQFLVTPAVGLVDTYFSLGFDINSYTTKVLAVYHDYESDEKSAATNSTVDFGKEWDIQVMKTIGANWNIGAKYGKYSEGSDTIAGVTKKDAKKAWAWVELNF